MSLLALSACGGIDKPFVLNEDDPLPPVVNPGVGGENPGGGNGEGEETGCFVNYSGGLFAEAFRSSGALSNKTPFIIPDPIQLRFNGNEVILDNKNFPTITIDLTAQGAPAILFLEPTPDATEAKGTYDPATGEIEISGVKLQAFADLSPDSKTVLPPLTFTTKNASTSGGSFGDGSVDGSPLNSSLEISLATALIFPTDGLVGGSLGGEAITAIIVGTFDQDPTDPSCTGNGGGPGGPTVAGGGIKIFEVITKDESVESDEEISSEQEESSNGESSDQSSGENNTEEELGSSEGDDETDTVESPSEIELKSGVADFGSVFISPDAVKEDPRYKVVKTFRIENYSGKSFGINLENQEGFVFDTQGSVTLNHGDKKEITVSFFQETPEGESPSNKVEQKELSFELNEDTTWKLQGKVKPEGPLLTLEGFEVDEPGTVDLGETLIKVNNVNGQQVLNCGVDGARGFLVKKVVIKNNGVKDLHIKSISQAFDSDDDGEIGQFCENSGSEFFRSNLVFFGSASCTKYTIGNDEFNNSDCKIPADSPDSRIEFKVIYYPKNNSNEKSPELNIPDYGTITIINDDPIYDLAQGQEAFKINLKATTSIKGESPIRMQLTQEDGQATNRDPIEPNSVQTLKVNVEQSSQNKKLTLSLLNNTADIYKINKLDDFGESENFALTGEAPTEIPAVNEDGSPGKVDIEVTFDPKGQPGPFIAQWNLEVINERSIGGNTPEGEIVPMVFNLEGLVGDIGLKGRYRMRMDFLTALITADAISAPIKSLNFNDSESGFDLQRPDGPIIEFSDRVLEDGTVDSRYRKAKLEDISLTVEQLENMTAQQRSKLLRILNAQMTVGKNEENLVPGDDSTLCNEPQNIKINTYTNGDCAYFYFGLTASEGLYDIFTGQLILPDVRIQVLNPYHKALGTTFDVDKDLDTEIVISLTTLKLESARGFENQILIPDVENKRIKSSEIPVPKNKIFTGDPNTEPGPCPPEGVDLAKKPEFKCFLSESNGKYFITGTPLQSLEGSNGQKITLAGIAKFTDEPINAGAFFLKDGPAGKPARMYLALKGLLEPIEE